ncbi:hypothetical protein KIW84_063083 [Lathyrus oleraceus]|uniref:Integrase catalytic domain-containing protein n=1 Tax=Pisum sativum TaxID=3888 RepID=A0A9D4WA60_PEA|nr:hypothetical protein KIW84_063083 [Pisum sativum]
MKAHIHQLRSELMTSKKCTRSISEYVLRIRTISNSLLAIGDLTDMYEVEALLYVQEVKLDKYKQELSTSSASSNINHGSFVHTHARNGYSRVQSDLGDEFRPLTKLLNEQGIIYRLTRPHTSHEKAKVERKHKHIVELGLALLAHATMPIIYWDHSFTTAVYLIDRLPTSALPRFSSPFEVVHNKQPDYSSLRMFGCAYYPCMGTYNKHNLEFKSYKCVYFGVSPTHKGFKCLNSEGRVFISKDVVFHEVEFPFKHGFTTTGIPDPSSLGHKKSMELYLPIPIESKNDGSTRHSQ